MNCYAMPIRTKAVVAIENSPILSGFSGGCVKKILGNMKKVIKDMTRKNNGQPAKIIGANGLCMDLSEENWNKLLAKADKSIDTFKKKTLP